MPNFRFARNQHWKPVTNTSTSTGSSLSSPVAKLARLMPGTQISHVTATEPGHLLDVHIRIQKPVFELVVCVLLFLAAGTSLLASASHSAIQNRCPARYLKKSKKNLDLIGEKINRLESMIEGKETALYSGGSSGLTDPKEQNLQQLMTCRELRHKHEWYVLRRRCPYAGPDNHMRTVWVMTSSQ